MKYIYDIIEDLAWWIDGMCHDIIEWAQRKRFGEHCSERWK